MFVVTRFIKDDFEVFEYSACFLANFWQFYLQLWEIPKCLQGRSSNDFQPMYYL